MRQFPACVTIPACAAPQRKAKSSDLVKSGPMCQAVPGKTCWQRHRHKRSCSAPGCLAHTCCANTGVSAIKQTGPRGQSSWKVIQEKNKSYSLVRPAHQPGAAMQRSVLAGKNNKSTQNRQERSSPLSRSSHQLKACDTRPGSALRWLTTNRSPTEPRWDPAPQTQGITPFIHLWLGLCAPWNPRGW